MTQLPKLGRQREEKIESQVLSIVRTVLKFEVPATYSPLDGYIPDRADVQGLTKDQGQALKAIRLGLENAEATLKNGKKVTTYTDALKWMIERAVRKTDLPKQPE
jgi:hypothetical protein